jgi:hypothetical protein
MKFVRSGISMSNEDKNHESDSTVWTSYSDLFTNVAIIFLVMFVFALVKATVSQFRTVQSQIQHSNELKAKLSEADINQGKERIAKVEKTVSEMVQYEHVIDAKVLELNEYAKKLQSNKQVLKDIIESQAKQDAMMNSAHEQLKLEQNQRKQKEIALEKAQKQIKSFDQKENSQMELIAKLQRQMSEVELQFQENRLTTEKLGRDKAVLSEKLASFSKQNEGLKKEYETLVGKYNQVNAHSKGIADEAASLNSKLAQSSGDADKWKGEFQKKLWELDHLKGQLAESQGRFNQLAQTMSKLKDSIKNGVATKLKEKFKEKKLDAQVDPKTGEVVLLSGEAFNFEKGSAKLSKDAKSVLKKLIPIYSEVLLGDPKILSQISTISMEGHSSPSFAKKYVDPEVQNADAYSYNMKLSALRAASVANYLMGNDIGNYPHKDKMKTLLQSVGFGYMKPLRLDTTRRTLASEKIQDCGPWDCSRSQRVQINFLLKDNMEEIYKIINANGGIK